MFKELKKSWRMMSHQIYNIIKDTEISKRKINRIMELKSTITEIF